MFLKASPLINNTNKGIAVAIVLVGAFGCGVILFTQNTSKQTMVLIAVAMLVMILSFSIYSQLVLDINRAIKRGDFHIHFQPIVSTSRNSTELIGLEVLLRWEHPTLGNIPPARFIDKAERTGHIIPLTKHLFQLVEQSITQDDQLKILNFLNINVSPTHFTANFAHDASSLLSKGVFINFEITEKTKILFNPSVHSALSELSNHLGAGLVLDDFGTGYNTFDALLNYELTAIKVDKSLVDRLPMSDPKVIDLLEIMVSLGRRFNLMIIAEGVETSEQREQLLNLGINLHQGFFYGRPLPLKEITFKSDSFRESQTVEDKA